MFKWLADMIVKTPVQGTCSCCEGKKEQLKKMQKALLEQNESEKEDIFGEESCHCGGACSCGGKCHCHEENGRIPVGASFSSASYSAAYHFDQSTGQYNRAVSYHFDHSADDDCKHGCCCQQHDKKDQQGVGCV